MSDLTGRLISFFLGVVSTLVCGGLYLLVEIDRQARDASGTNQQVNSWLKQYDASQTRRERETEEWVPKKGLKEARVDTIAPPPRPK